MNGANQLVQNFNWQTPSWDLFIFIFWAVASVFYAFAAGRGRIVVLLMSLYIAKLLVLEAPWLTTAINEKLPSNLASVQQLVTFLVIFVLLFILLSRYAFRTSAESRRFGSIAFGLVFAVLQIGLLLNTVLRYLSVSGKQFSALVNFIFLSNASDFFWTVAPLIFLIILGKSIADPTEI